MAYGAERHFLIKLSVRQGQEKVRKTIAVMVQLVSITCGTIPTQKGMKWARDPTRCGMLKT